MAGHGLGGAVAHHKYVRGDGVVGSNRAIGRGVCRRAAGRVVDYRRRRNKTVISVGRPRKAISSTKTFAELKRKGSNRNRTRGSAVPPPYLLTWHAAARQMLPRRLPLLPLHHPTAQRPLGPPKYQARQPRRRCPGLPLAHRRSGLPLPRRRPRHPARALPAALLGVGALVFELLTDACARPALLFLQGPSPRSQEEGGTRAAPRRLHCCSAMRRRPCEQVAGVG